MDDGHMAEHEPMIHEDLLQAISDLNEALKPSLHPNSAPYELKPSEDCEELSSGSPQITQLESSKNNLISLRKDIEPSQASVDSEAMKGTCKDSEEALQHLVALQDSVLMTLNSNGDETNSGKRETKKTVTGNENTSKDSASKEYLTNGIVGIGENSNDVSVENISEDSVHSGAGTLALNCKSSESDENNAGKNTFPKFVNSETNDNSMDSDHTIANTKTITKSNSVTSGKNGNISDDKIESLKVNEEEKDKAPSKNISPLSSEPIEVEISNVKTIESKTVPEGNVTSHPHVNKETTKPQAVVTIKDVTLGNKNEQILKLVEEKSALVKELEKEVLSSEEMRDSAKALEGGWILTPASHIVKVLFEYPPTTKIPDFLKENKATVEPTYNKELKFGAVDNFLMDIGLNLAREWVHIDLVRGQKRKRKKDDSEATERHLKSLEATLEVLRKKNDVFHHKSKRCRICTFQTESQMVLSTHRSVPHHGAHGTMRCTYCDFETRQPYVMKFHMEAEHSVVARLEPPPSFFQCPLCPFETNTKTQLTKHQFRCSKTFDPKNNLAPDLSENKSVSASALNSTMGNKQWPPNIAPNRPTTASLLQYQQQQAAFNKMNQNSNLYRVSGGVMPGMAISSSNLNQSFNSRNFISNLRGMQIRQSMMVNQQNPYMRSPYILNNQGTFYVNAPNNVMGTRAQLPSTSLYQMNSLSYPYPLNQSQGIYLSPVSTPMISGSQYVANVNVPGRRFPAPQPVSVVPNIANSSIPTPVALVTNVANSSQKVIQPGTSGLKFTNIQSSHKTGVTVKNLLQGSKESPSSNIPMAGNIQSNSNFVICEICDGYIKDLDSLRVHLLWIHKIKIGAKIIKGLPPLNCQKCQYRFFTYQGLERHLLGVHRLVTSSMQDSAKHARDMGRCNLCGKMFESNLLTHLKSFHNLDLKPAHLTYRCTVCSSSFTSYQTFENHVYSAHSSVAKNMLDESVPSSSNKPKVIPPQNRIKSTSSPMTTNRCYFCKATFSSEAELGEHLNTVHHLVSGRPGHSNVRKTCSKCGLIFVQYTRLIKHWKRSHLRPLSIKLCRVDKCELCKKLLEKPPKQEKVSQDKKKNNSSFEIMEIDDIQSKDSADEICEVTEKTNKASNEIFQELSTGESDEIFSEVSKDILKEASDEISKESFEDIPKELPKEISKDISEELSKESHEEESKTLIEETSNDSHEPPSEEVSEEFCKESSPNTEETPEVVDLTDGS